MRYNYFQDYDPSFGRCTQSDPIGPMVGLAVKVINHLSDEVMKVFAVK